MPFVGRVHTQPAETDGIGCDADYDQDVGAKGAKVGKGADEEEDDGLDGERDAIGEKNNGIDCSDPAGEVEELAVTSCLI